MVSENGPREVTSGEDPLIVSATSIVITKGNPVGKEFLRIPIGGGTFCCTRCF